MPGCTTTFSCWVEAHAYVVWIVGILVAVGFVFEAVYLWRQFKRIWQEMREVEQWRAEERNEWKALQHKIQSTIRRGEEWNVNVQPLKEANQRLILMRKAERLIEREKTRMILPLPFLMLFVFAIGIVPTIWTVVICGAILVAMIIWWIYHGWMWSRYHWFLQVLIQEEAKAKAQEETKG